MSFQLDSIVWIIVGITCLLSYIGFTNSSFFERFKFQVGAILSGERIRLLSSGFLHVDYMHLLVNMFTLGFFADFVVNDLGHMWFVVIYLFSLLIGNLLSLAIYKKEPSYSAVGASGAVMGVLYSAILLEPDMELVFILLPFVAIPGYLFAIGFLLYSIYGMKQRSDNIGHAAHFGGAIGGFIFTLLLRPAVIWQKPWLVILMSIPILILLYLEKKGRLQKI